MVTRNERGDIGRRYITRNRVALESAPEIK